MPTHKLATALVPQIAGLKLEQIKIEHQFISMFMVMMSPTARCPLCAKPASRIHSHYTRTIADLPWSTFIVRLRLRIRKFVCHTSNYPRHIFAERVPELVAPYARRTVRQGEIVRVVCLAVGARAGSRLAKRLQMLVSPSTMLRLLRQTPQQIYPTPRVLGVDDFAHRKGSTYGTILVDLEKHRPIELLPTRSAAALTAWLRAHPGIEIITRDRSTEYTRGISEGAPTAIQVADRFHILCNLRDALERVLDHNRAKLAGITLPRETGKPGELGAQPHQMDQLHERHQLHQPAQRSYSELLVQQERRQRRQQTYEHVNRLYAEGVTIHAISKQLGICRMTVYRYLRLDVEPTQLQRRAMRSILDPYVPYLAERWNGGCHNGGQLWHELRELGYPGSRRMVIVWAAQQREKQGIQSPYTPSKYRDRVQPGKILQDGANSPTKPPVQPVQPAASSRRLAWFLVREQQSLDMVEQAVLAQIREACQDASRAYQLVHDFHKIVKGRLGEQLAGWLKAASESGIVAMQNFAAGIMRDKAAILAAITLDWSNGQVEGQVNRLKLRKRQLYGRANFDLLRQYVLNAP